MLTQLLHNGVVVPEPPAYQGLVIRVLGKDVKLNPKQEEMALAWAKKQGTPYVEDLVFVKNFVRDFCKALNLDQPKVTIQDFDFSAVIAVVEAERAAKAALTKEERKALAAERKRVREKMKKKFGKAIADGEEIELANYVVEPSSIFMGRGKHPLRGRWKEGAVQKDICLNLSPDAPVPEGDWGEIVWQPDSLWVAKWTDKLTGKLKYVWLHDTAPIKQAREAQKFDKAFELNSVLDQVRKHINDGLHSDNPRRRKIATACHLIDTLCLRVGDEKDPEEADTVGATTLRPEHIKFHNDGLVEFRFLGKDSVLWHKKITFSDHVIKNIKELVENAKPSRSGINSNHPIYSKPQLFHDVSSRNVNEFLSEAMPGLTAKVFRTNHATAVVKQALKKANVDAKDPEYRKWEAAVKANMEAAILCNHTKQPPKNWQERKKKYREREEKAKLRIKKVKNRQKELKQKLKELRKEEKEKLAKTDKRDKKKKIRERYKKRIESKLRTIENTKIREEKAHHAYGKLKVQKAIASENRTWNLGTSQKSYIDPRVYFNWGQQVKYDVLDKYYSKTLELKFQWVRNKEYNPEAEEQPGEE